MHSQIVASSWHTCALKQFFFSGRLSVTRRASRPLSGSWMRDARTAGAMDRYGGGRAGAREEEVKSGGTEGVRLRIPPAQTT